MLIGHQVPVLVGCPAILPRDKSVCTGLRVVPENATPGGARKDSDVRQRKRRKLGSAVLGLGAALVLAGCGAGQLTQTDSQQSAVNGAQAQTGALLARDAGLLYPDNQVHGYPVGSDAPLRLTFVNNGKTDDELVAVSSPAATTGTVQGSTRVVAASTLRVAPSQAQAPNPTPERVGHAQISLRGLKRDIRPGQTIPVTFSFRDAGPLTVDMPIHASDQPRPEGATQHG